MIVRWLFGEAHDRQVELARSEIGKATRVDAEDRPERWDACWREVADDYRRGKNPELVPPYLRRTVARVGGAYAIVSPDFLPCLQRTLVMALARKFFTHKVVELGCGAGFNLRTLAHAYAVRGYDRSAVAVEAAMCAGLDAARCGDLRSDVTALDLTPGAGILTVGSMEQLGTHWRALFERLVAHDGPIVHIEPLEELYGQDQFDRLARDYHHARGYLSGYLPMLWSDKRVKIIEQRRLRVGSAFNDGFSYVAWRSNGTR